MKTKPTLEQIRQNISRLDDNSILSSLETMREMALMLGERSSAAILVIELSREGVKRGILK